MSVRILYVDDEPDIREVAEMSLQLDPGIEVRTCASGKDAILVAGEWGPHLVLLDVMMPGMDGLEVFSELRKDPRAKDIPVVFITARTQGADVSRLMQLGAVGVIAKPFDPLQLAAEARAYLAKGSGA